MASCCDDHEHASKRLAAGLPLKGEDSHSHGHGHAAAAGEPGDSCCEHGHSHGHASETTKHSGHGHSHGHAAKKSETTKVRGYHGQ